MKDFDEFSTSDIEEMAQKASKEARNNALKAGNEIASQDLETGEHYLEKLDENGNIVRRPMPDNYIETISTERKP
ncbi:hypothetical protein [Agarilytica rhodophyticola]|uniref:hypothetical protein n=1 Tax=Agarilytica rhodophyticola TaxID=1737490 RepID=UPI000B343B32|nr:hypothetical protein [Agarilytica rhodophyticola]